MSEANPESASAAKQDALGVSLVKHEVQASTRAQAKRSAWGGESG